MNPAPVREDWNALLADEARRRHEFPVAERSIFMAHAAVAPLPRRVAEAVAAAATASTLGPQENAFDAPDFKRTRDLAARLLQCAPREIALVGPTSLALSFVARGLPWKSGDNVVCYFEDYPSNVYPWLALRDQGVEARLVKPETPGRIEWRHIEPLLDGRTRLVALASCHFLSGYRLDVSAIGKALRDRGILFCVDAIQTLGAQFLNVRDVDFLAADAHKWLLGPCGAGILYVRESAWETLRPVAHGWHNVHCPDFLAEPEIRLKPDARRYEAGTAPLLCLAGLRAALELIDEVSLQVIDATLARRRARLLSSLVAAGWEVLHAEAPPECLGPMVATRRPGRDPAEDFSRLEKADIRISLRKERRTGSWLRISPHFYNTDDELDRVIQFLKGA